MQYREECDELKSRLMQANMEVGTLKSNYNLASTVLEKECRYQSAKSIRLEAKCKELEEDSQLLTFQLELPKNKEKKLQNDLNDSLILLLLQKKVSGVMTKRYVVSYYTGLPNFQTLLLIIQTLTLHTVSKQAGPPKFLSDFQYWY